jgi:hypothetical protein
MKILKIKLVLLATLIFYFISMVSAPAYAACDTNATPEKATTNAAVNKCLQENLIVVRLNEIINFLSAAVVIVITGVIILGGIQYILAGDNATALTAARQRIINGLIALAVFLLMYAFLQWLVPGGVFKK